MIGNKALWHKLFKLKFKIISIILLVLSGLISLHQLAYYQKIYPHVFVDNVEISNLNIDQATERINQLLPTEAPEIKLGLGSQTWAVDTSSLGLEYRSQETAENAYLVGRSEGFWQNLFAKWAVWTQSQYLPVKLVLDEAELLRQVDMISAQIEELPVQPYLSLDLQNKLELTPGKNGRGVDKGLLFKKIYEQLGHLKFETIEVSVTKTEANVSQAELVDAWQRAEKIKDKKLIINSVTFSETIAKQELIDLVSFESEAKIASRAAYWSSQVNRPPQNAAFRFDGNRVVEFKPALTGVKVNELETIALVTEALNQLATSEAVSQKITLSIKTAQPEIATEQVNDLGIKELLGMGDSTFHHSIASREHNVALTAQKLKGILVPPGEVFSFNQAVGDISATTGYQSAYIIKDGRTILGDGGGVCQDSTTMFRAALDAGLEIVERHPHSYRVTYYEQNAPAGIDATVYAPSVDLKFKNDTPAHILIQTTVNTATNYLKIEIYGTSDGRQASITNTRLWDQSPPPPDLYEDDPTLPAGAVKQVDWAAWGAKAAFDWQVVRNGEILHQKTFYTNYRPWQAVYLRGTGGV